MNKITKYVFCLCFVCSIAGAVISMPKIDFSYFDSKSHTEILTEQKVSATAQMIFCEVLNSNDINYRKIIVDTNKLRDGSIVISRVTIFTNEDSSKVSQAIHSDEYEVVVINE